MKKSASGFILLIAAFLSRRAVFAQESNIPATGPAVSNTSKLHGLEFGIRAGYGFALSTADSGRYRIGTSGFRFRVARIIPFWIDLGYRINPNWYVGAFFQYAIGRGLDDCSRLNLSPMCSSNDLRFGVNAHYHFRPDRTLDPWVGVGAGYEVLNYSLQASRAGFDEVFPSFGGFEFGNVQLGLDYKASHTVGLGPFVVLTIAQFSNEISKLYYQSGVHEWLIFGIRGTFDLILH